MAEDGGDEAAAAGPVEVRVDGVASLGAFRLLGLTAPADFRIGAPGRFHMVRDPDGPELLPWAVALVPHPAGGPALLVGSGGATAGLARARRLAVLGPLGHGFLLEGLDPARTVVVAQGHGVGAVAGLVTLPTPPPVLYGLGPRGDDGSAATALLGPRVDVMDADALGGRLDALLAGGSLRHVLVAAPDALTADLAARCRAAAVSCQVALEAPMACGFGACFGCVVRLDGVWRRLCLDGPVVDARRLEAR